MLSNTVLELSIATSSVSAVSVSITGGPESSSGSAVSVSITGGPESSSTVMVDGPATATFVGGDGNDHFTGGVGNDWIAGGLGADTLTGGVGMDRFIYAVAAESPVAGGDVIADFDATADLLVFRGLLHSTFAFRGTAGFTGSNNSEARFDDATKLLSVDLDGNGAADMGITLIGVPLANLDRSDFLWS